MANRLARYLRKTPTDAERRLWYHLRHRAMGGHRFRRQAPIGPYIVDFVCPKEQLVVAVDGGQHASRQQADAERDEWLGSQGYRVLRFWNHEVFADLETVLEVIWRALNGEKI